MIDYLERLFFPDKRDWEREQARPAPSPPGEEHPRNPAVSALGEAEEPQDMAAVKLQREEVQALAAAGFNAEEPQSMAASFRTEELQALAEAALWSEEVQALRGVFPEGEAPEKMTEPRLRGEEMAQSQAMTVPEQEAVQPLFAAAVREIEYEAGQMRYRIGNVPEEQHAPRAALFGERGQELARVSMAWEEPVSEAYRSRIPARYGPGEWEEDLEHRLRRNSRRYDSGFFLY